jgi:4-hydroxy-3-methylbut-2-enyl diphosphate reductase
VAKIKVPPLVKTRGKLAPNKVRSDTSKKSPQTMEELLKQTGYQLRGLKRGDEVKTTVVEKTKKAIYLDIGGKTEGMVIDREMKAAKSFIETLKVGDKVTAVVTQPENDRGQTILSLKKAAGDALWQEFEEKLKTGEVVKVLGLEVNKGGLIVETKGGIQGFIPTSQLSAPLVGKIGQLINREIEVKTIEVSREKNRLIFSEKEVSEAGLLKAQAKILAKIKIGDVLEGEVTGLMPFGLFVKVKVPPLVKTRGTSLEGLVHISEISWEKVENPADLCKVGDKVKVKVLAVEEKSGKLNLSLKQLQPDPWENIEKKYPLDSHVKGEIVRLAPFGAFVNLAPGIEGLIHISKIPAEKSLKLKDKVNCFVESTDKQGRRMSLGLVLKEKPVGYK